MLSILIPTYNYNVFPLAKVLSAEAETIAHPIEIIILDDASTLLFDETEKVEALPFVTYSKLAENGGRTATRQLLAEKASYSKLLFLDADVLPVHTDFIAHYLKHIEKKGIVFGGITYEKEKPNRDEMLRWTYGHARETLTIAQRNKNLYSSINSGCFCIDSAIFISINNSLQHNSYGMDLLFKQLLEKENIAVLHIDNPVYHLGLESNNQFLKKSLEAIATTVILEESGELPKDSRKIQKIYLTLKKWYALPMFQLYFSTIASKVKRNLLSEVPNMRWFDLYRLNYYIQLKQKKGA